VITRDNADLRFNNAGIAGEGSREGYEKSEDVDKYSQQLLRSEFKEWDDILRTNVTAHYVCPPENQQTNEDTVLIASSPQHPSFPS
jgi:hypothetical protein